MSHREVRNAVSLAIGLCLLFTVTRPLAAQGVTGTVSGTVKDAQGGVIPGATVTLISESKGTRSSPSSPTAPATSSSRTSPPTPTRFRSRCRRSRR